MSRRVLPLRLVLCDDPIIGNSEGVNISEYPRSDQDEDHSSIASRGLSASALRSTDGQERENLDSE